MTEGAESPSRLEVQAASLEQKGLLANLLELYCHDFSEFIPLQPGADGRFGYKHLDLYWTEPGRFPMLFYTERVPAGFALVRRVSEEEVWDMAEFFVMRGFRRRGVGIGAAQQVFARFPGPWQVRVMEANREAAAFWSRAVQAFAGGRFSARQVVDGGREWNVFWFTSPPG